MLSYHVLVNDITLIYFVIVCIHLWSRKFICAKSKWSLCWCPFITVYLNIIGWSYKKVMANSSEKNFQACFHSYRRLFGRTLNMNDVQWAILTKIHWKLYANHNKKYYIRDMKHSFLQQSYYDLIQEWTWVETVNWL